MRSTNTFFAVLLVVSLVSGHALSNVPHLINFQGTLTDSSGTPINDIIGRMQVSLYMDSVGGISYWSEIHSEIPVNDGLFRIILGSENPLSPLLFSGNVLWIGIMIAPDSQDLYPRQPLVHSVAGAVF